MKTIWDRASRELGGLDAIDLSREVIDSVQCPSCGASRPVRKPAEAVGEDEVVCQSCGGECVPKFFHSLGAGSDLLSLTPAQLGMPEWDVVWARLGTRMIGIEMSADRIGCLAQGDPSGR